MRAHAPSVAASLAWSPDVAADYRAFVDGKRCGAAQYADWVETWARTQQTEIVVLRFAEQGNMLAAMPLEIVRQRGLTIAQAVGGGHANGSFPAMRGDFSASTDLLQPTLAAIRAARPDIDLLRIERLAPDLEGVPNPLRFLPHARSANIALAVDLSAGFDAVLERVGRKRRLKKHRAQTRKLEAAGGYRRIQASTPAEVDRLMEAYLAMKAERFAKLGITNVFAGVETFWAELFKRSLDQAAPSFLLHGLDVGGKLRAVTGSSVVGNRLICEFGGITEDELAGASPGDFLFFEHVQAAAREGFAVYDFSVGDEPYKRNWCDIETEQFDVIAPLSLKGRAYAQALRRLTGIKRRIKANDRLWAIVKRLRRRAASQKSEPAADADEA